MRANAKGVLTMLNHWNFREGTEQVYQLLRDLSQDLLLWGWFFDEPLSVIRGYGLSVPEGIIRGNLRFRRRPPARLFQSGLDWLIFDDEYLSHDGGATKSIESLHRACPNTAMEIHLVLSGTKPSARLLVREDYVGAVIHFLVGKNMPFVLSPFKSTDEPGERKGGVSNLVARKLPFNAPDKGAFMVYVSLDGARAQTALLLEALSADRELGRTLGYPECCIQFFVENWNTTASTHQGDLVPFSLQNTNQSPPYPFYLNNLAYYFFEVRLISHFPCRYTCTASLALGKRYLEALQKDAPELAEEIQKLLLCPVVYTDTEGLFLLEEFSQLPDGRVAYNPDRIRATVETSPLHRLLRTADRINMKNGGKLFLYQGNKLVGETHSHVWCLTFTEG